MKKSRRVIVLFSVTQFNLQQGNIPFRCLAVKCYLHIGLSVQTETWPSLDKWLVSFSAPLNPSIQYRHPHVWTDRLVARRDSMINLEAAMIYFLFAFYPHQMQLCAREYGTQSSVLTQKWDTISIPLSNSAKLSNLQTALEMKTSSQQRRSVKPDVQVCNLQSCLSFKTSPRTILSVWKWVWYTCKWTIGWN